MRRLLHQSALLAEITELQAIRLETEGTGAVGEGGSDRRSQSSTKPPIRGQELHDAARRCTRLHSQTTERPAERVNARDSRLFRVLCVHNSNGALTFFFFIFFFLFSGGSLFVTTQATAGSWLVKHEAQTEDI